MSVINWTDYFIEIAKTVSLRSNCIRRQVGAIIVDEHKKIKATGLSKLSIF
jgi:dCMP deaminase